MDNNILEKEEITNGTVEDVTDEVNELRESCASDNLEEPIEEISIPDEPSEEVSEETTEEPTPEEAEETANEPISSEIEVAPIEKAEETVPEEASQKEEKDEDALPFFKTVKWQRTWSRCSAIILALLFAIPLGILAYTVLTFFL